MAILHLSRFQHHIAGMATVTPHEPTGIGLGRRSRCQSGRRPANIANRTTHTSSSQRGYPPGMPPSACLYRQEGGEEQRGLRHVLDRRELAIDGLFQHNLLDDVRL